MILVRSLKGLSCSQTAELLFSFLIEKSRGVTNLHVLSRWFHWEPGLKTYKSTNLICSAETLARAFVSAVSTVSTGYLTAMSCSSFLGPSHPFPLPDAIDQSSSSAPLHSSKAQSLSAVSAALQPFSCPWDASSSTTW